MALTPQQRRRRAYNNILIMQMMAAYKSSTSSASSAASTLLATWADSNGGLAFDFTDITSSQPYGSGKIIDGATPANNWETSSSLTPFDKLTWTGASLRMCYGSDGVLRYAPHNLIDYSQDQSNAAWTKTSVTVVADDAVAPDGTTTADKCTYGAINNHFNTTSIPANSEVSTSFYFKYSSGQWFLFQQTDGSNGIRVWVDCQNAVLGTSGTVGTGGTLTSATIEAAANGYYKVTLIGKIPASTVYPGLVGVNANNSTSSAAGELWLWGWQVQALPVHSTDYIATTSSAVYRPRIDYDPSTLAVRGLLVEEQRTNLLTYSQDFSNAAWTKFNLNTTGTPDYTDVITAPDGTSTADVLIPAATLTDHSFYQTGLGGAGTYTLSGYFKAAGYNRIQLYIFQGAFLGRITARLDNGTIGAASGTGSPSGTITSVGNGWYCVTLTATTTGAFEVGYYAVNDSDATSFAGDTTSGIYIWGAQLEAGAFATSYIPTTSASATRAADDVSLASSAFNYSTTLGTMFWQFINSANAAHGGLYLSNGFTTYHELRANQFSYGYYSSSGSASTVVGGYDGASGLVRKVAGAYGASRQISAHAGSVGSSQTVGTYGSITLLRIAANQPNSGSVQGSLWVQKVMALPRDTANADLQTLTT